MGTKVPSRINMERKEEIEMKALTITRKITLFPQGDKQEVDRTYKYIRDGMEVQSLVMNQCISALYCAKLRKADKDEIKEITHLYSHIPTSKLGSAYDFDMDKYPTGLPLAGSIPRVCKQKLDKACKDGLMYGKVSLPTFKKTMPLMVHNDYVNILGTKKTSNGGVKNTGFYHDYENPMDLVEALETEEKPKIHIRFANGIVFDIVLGNPHRSAELRSVLAKAFSGEYKICDSTIGFDKRTGKKIELNLSLQIPVTERKLDESTVVGVDLGLAVPAVCALNNDKYNRLFIGNYDDFTRVRTQMKSQRKRIQSALKHTSGGHGRKKKLAHLEKLSMHEREFAKTYNHMVSRKVVEYAVARNAKYIKLEDLSGYSADDRSNFCLRNWSYYELQNMIEYKAQKEGMEVLYIKPAYTSQTCSICGERGIRKEQAEFICTNPNCECHKIYDKGFNADFNAARNIAMSTNFKEEKPKKAKKIKIA